MARFKKDKTAQEALANTVKLSSVKSQDFDTARSRVHHGADPQVR
jgi:hypothetical protein